MAWWLACLIFAGDPTAGNPFAGKTTGKIGIVQVVRSYDTTPEDVDEPGYVLDLSTLSNGALAVLEGKSNRVYLWDENGKFVNTVGGDGEGPGELASPNLVAYCHNRLYVYEANGDLTIYTRDASGFSTKKSQKLFVKAGLPRVFMSLHDGDEKLMMARNNGGLEKAPLVVQIVNPADGSLTELEKLRKTPSQAMWNIANMSNPKDELLIGSPRLWASRRPEGGVYFGFSETNNIQLLDPTGKSTKTLKTNLPKLPVEPEIEIFMTTPVAIIEKTVRDMEVIFNAKLNVKTDGYMSYYTQFLKVDDSLLFFVSPIGGFQYADYLYNGHCLVYNLKKEEITARGRLVLPEDAKLFITEDRPMLAVFDDEDRLVLKEVRLGWVR